MGPRLHTYIQLIAKRFQTTLSTSWVIRQYFLDARFMTWSVPFASEYGVFMLDHASSTSSVRMCVAIDVFASTLYGDGHGARTFAGRRRTTVVGRVSTPEGTADRLVAPLALVRLDDAEHDVGRAGVLPHGVGCGDI